MRRHTASDEQRHADKDSDAAGAYTATGSPTAVVGQSQQLHSQHLIIKDVLPVVWTGSERRNKQEEGTDDMGRD